MLHKPWRANLGLPGHLGGLIFVRLLELGEAVLPGHSSLPLTGITLILGDGEEMEVICQQNLPGVGAGVGKGIVLFCT